jgi:hypothetical protein
MSETPTAERLVSAAAIALYAASCLALMWDYAHDYARTAVVAQPKGTALAAVLAAVFIIPLLAGVGTGRYWAPALILILFICTGIGPGTAETPRARRGRGNARAGRPLVRRHPRAAPPRRSLVSQAAVAARSSKDVAAGLKGHDDRCA